MDFDVDPETQSVEYKPVGVKDLLIEMKDSSELIVDLAYSALLHNSESLAEEVLELEQKMDMLQMQARMNLLMASRTTDDAKRLAPVLGIVGATEKISEAAGDIATVVLSEMELPRAIKSALPEAMEVLSRATVADDSPYAGRQLGTIGLETETGVRVIGLRRDDQWVLNPDSETTINAGDMLLLRGTESNVSGVFETVSGEVFTYPAGAEEGITDLSRAVDTIVLMKNVSELSVDLAYASVLADDTKLAQEVRSLEVEVDGLKERLEAWALQAASDMDDPVRLRGLLHLASSTEIISDAALEISEGILRNIETHPVISESVRESDVAVRRVVVGPNSKFVETDIGALLDAYPGGSIIAIHRQTDEWNFYPDDDAPIVAGDVLIVRGTWDATGELLSELQAS